jgi:hypothetical protein
MDIPATPGWVWVIDGISGNSTCAHLIPWAGDTTLPLTPSSHPVGIIMNGEKRGDIPGTITLVSTGKQIGVTVQIASPAWRYFTPGACAVCGIGAVPQGLFTVHLPDVMPALESNLFSNLHGGFTSLPQSDVEG